MFRTGAYASTTGGQAAVTLVNASAALSQSGNTSWTLTKTGTVDTNASTVPGALPLPRGRPPAVFDNNTLKLADGTAVRAETIISIGNSTSKPPSAQNVDINGAKLPIPMTSLSCFRKTAG